MAAPTEELGLNKQKSLETKSVSKKISLAKQDFFAANPNATLQDLQQFEKQATEDQINQYYREKRSDLIDNADPRFGVSDESLNSKLGKATNIGLALGIEGTGRLIEQGLTAGSNVANFLTTGEITQDELNAFQSARTKLTNTQNLGKQLREVEQNTSLDEETKNQTIAGLKQDLLNNQLTEQENLLLEPEKKTDYSGFIPKETVRDSKYKRLLDAEARDKLILEPTKKFFDTSAQAWVNRKETDELAASAKDDWSQIDFQTGAKQVVDGQVIQGAGNVTKALVETFGSVIENIVENPSGVATEFVKSVPQMAFANVAAIPAATTMSVSLAADAKDKFIERNGRVPEGKEIATILSTAVAGAFLETIGAKATLTTPATKGALAATGKVGFSALTEGSTEFIQGALEEYGYKQDVNDLDFNEAFLGSIVGFAGGGSLSAVNPNSGIGQVAAGTLRSAANIAKATGTAASTGAKFLAGLGSKDKAESANEEGENLEPSNTAGSIDIEESYDTPTANAPDTLEATNEVKTILEPYKALAKEFQELGSKIDENTDDDIKNEFASKGIELLQLAAQISEDAATSEDPALVEASNRILREGRMAQGIQEAVSLANAQQEELTKLFEDAGSEIDPDIQREAGEEFISGMQKAAKRVLYSTILPTSNSSIAMVEALVSTAKKVPGLLSKPEVAQLNKYISYKTAQQVQNDVLTGTDKLFTGVDTHIKNISSFLEEGNVSEASKNLNRLKSFYSQQQAKLDAVSGAIPIAEENKETITLEEFPQLDASGKPNGNPTFIDGTSLKGINSAKKLARSIQNSVATIAPAVSAAETMIRGAVNYQNDALNLIAQGMVEGTEVTPEVTTTPPTEETVTETNTTESVEAPVRNVDSIRTELDTSLSQGDFKRATELVNELEALGDVSKETTLKEESTATDLPEEGNEVAPKQRSLEDQIDDALADGDTNLAAELTNELALKEDPNWLNKLDVVGVDLSSVNTEKGGSKSGIKSLSETTKLARTKNAIKEYFSVTNKGALQKEPNLIDLFKQSVSGYQKLLGDYLDTSKLNESDAILLNNLKNFRNLFGKTYDTQLKNSHNRQDKQFLYNSAQMYLFENGDPSKSLIDAVTIAAYNWIAYESKSLTANDARAINKLLGNTTESGSANLSREHWNKLFNIGSFQSSVLYALGDEAYRNLGIKELENAPNDIKQKLIADMGASIISVLGSINLVESPKLSGKVFADLMRNSNPDLSLDVYNEQAKKKNIVFIRPKENKLVQAIQDKGSSSTRVTRMLSDPDAVTKKTYIGKPPKPRKKMLMSGTTQYAPGKAVREHNNIINQKYFMNNNMVNVATQFGDNFLRGVLGYEFNTDLGMNVVNTSYLGSNLGIDRDIENLNATKSKLDSLAEPIYFDYTFNSNMRHQMLGDFNLQASKLHRFMVGHSPSTIKLGDGTSQKERLLVLAIAQGLDMKPDKKSNNTVISQFEETFKEDSNSILNLAVRELKLSLQGEPADMDIILAGVKEGGEKIHSLKSLVTLAEYQLAKEAGSNEFSTDIMLEIDGVTNGPFNATVQLGLLQLNDTELDALERGGMYPRSTTPTNHNDEVERRGKTHDNYVNTATKQSVILTSTINDLKDPLKSDGATKTKAKQDQDNNLLQAASVLLKYTDDIIEGDEGTFEVSRGYVKQASTATVYGSGKRAISRKAFRSHLDKMYSVIDTNLRELELLDNIDSEEANTLINNIELVGLDIILVAETPVSNFTKGGGLKVIRNKIKLKDYPKNNQDRLTYWKEFEVASKDIAHMEKVFAPVIGKSLNEAIETSYANNIDRGSKITEMVKITYKLFLDQYEKAVKDRTKEWHDTGKLSQDYELPQKELDNIFKELSDVAPLYKHNFSKEGNYGTYIAVMESALSESGERVQASLGKLNPMVRQTTYADPGVRATALSTIGSGDAAMHILSNSFADNTDALNVFDAKFYTLDNLSKGNEALNGGAYHALMDHNQFGSFADMYGRSLINHPVLGDPSVSLDAKNSLLSNLFGDVEGYDFTSLVEKLEEVKGESLQIADAKKVVTQKGSFNQMATLTSIKMSKGNIVGTKLPKLNRRNKVNNITSEEYRNNLKEGKYNYTTELGTEIISKDRLRSLIDNDLRNSIKADVAVTAPVKILQQKVINVILKTLPDNLEVKYVSSLSGIEGVTSPELRNAAYVGNTIYIDRNKANSITVLHELIHAVTSRQVSDYYNNTGSNLNGVQKSAIKRLENLATQLRKVGSTPALDLAVSADNETAVNELLAYGLSDKASLNYLAQKPVSRVRKVVNVIVEGISKMLGVDIKPNVLMELTASFSEIAAGNFEANKVTNKVLYQTKYFNPEDIFESLVNSKTTSTNAEHTKHLANVLKNVNTKLITPLVTKFAENSNNSTTDEQAFIDSLDPTVKANHNTMLNSGFNMTPEESMVFQLYSETIQSSIKDQYYPVQKARKIFLAAKEKLSYKDFTDSQDPSKIALAKRQYNALFNENLASVNKGDTTYLSNFLAMATTNEKTREVLSKVQINPDRINRDTSLLGRVKNLIDQLLNFMSDKVNKTARHPDAKGKLDILAKQLVSIQAKKQNFLDKNLDGLNNIEAKGNAFLTTNVNRITKAMRNNKYVGDRSRFKTLSVAVVGAAAIFDGEQGKVFRKTVDDMVNSKRTNTKLGFVGELVNEVTGSMESSQLIDDIRRQTQGVVESLRQDIKETLPKEILKRFSFDLSKDESVAITKVALHTDLSSLIEAGYDMDNILEFMRNPSLLKREIQNITNDIGSLDESSKVINFYLNQANNLGRFMVTGKNYISYPLRNAYLIANLSGTGVVANDPREAQKHIDVLASLIALDQTESDFKRAFGDVANKELSADSDGLNSIIRIHQDIKKKDRSKTGDGYDNVYTKGFVYEITNPHKSVAFTSSPLDKVNLARKGFVKSDLINRDRADLSGEADMQMFISEDGGNVGFLQGAMSTIETMIGGVNPNSGKLANGTMPKFSGTTTVSKIHARKNVSRDALFAKQVNMDTPVNTLIPSFNTVGEINAYAYSLDHQTKDTLLDRDNSVEHVLSTWKARNEEEVRSKVLNSELVKALVNIYKSAPPSERKNFIRVDDKHPDPSVREVWGLMPDYMKKAILTETGKKYIMVHRNDINNALGYRKKSVLDLWDMDKKDKGLLTRAFLDLVDLVIPGNPAKFLRKGERGIQELVSEVKDWIIVKSVVVPAFNIISNIMQLYLRGVPVKDIVRNSAKAVHAARDYKDVVREIIQLEHVISIEDSPVEASKLNQRLTNLKSAQINNPVHELVLAGLMPSIVDEMTQAEETYSYKAGLLESIVAPFANQIPPTVRNVGKEVLITKDSKVYSALSQSVELGDFTAKYVRYIHMTENLNLSKQEAIQSVAVEFIDYGKLPSSTMQYLNDMGLANFFKYTIRIQAILLDIVRNSPMKVLALLITQGGVGTELATPFEASIFSTDFTAKTGLLDLLSGFFSHPVAEAL